MNILAYAQRFHLWKVQLSNKVLCYSRIIVTVCNDPHFMPFYRSSMTHSLSPTLDTKHPCIYNAMISSSNLFSSNVWKRDFAYPESVMQFVRVQTVHKKTYCLEDYTNSRPGKAIPSSILPHSTPILLGFGLSATYFTIFTRKNLVCCCLACHSRAHFSQVFNFTSYSWMHHCSRLTKGLNMQGVLEDFEWLEESL